MARGWLAAAAAVSSVAVLGLALSGCSTSGPGHCDTGKGTLVIGLIAPLTGELSQVGLGMRNSADLAVRQANDVCAVPGYHLDLQSRDDRADPATGAQAATAFTQDPSVIGVLGPFNSSVAQRIQPVLSDAGIVEISPGNTSVQLTRGANPVSAPLRQYATYFRTVATDSVQGPAAANYLAGPAGRKRVAVISDGKTYGEGIASEFSKQLATLGGQVVSHTLVPPGSAPAAAVAAVTRSRPDAVFYGGEYPDGGPLSRALGAAGTNVPVMGGDGIVNPDFVTDGGRNGDLGTSVGPPPESVPSARPFVQAYAQAGYHESSGSYGAFTYDAAQVLVRSTAGMLAGDAWSASRRPALVRAIQSYSGDGATGSISFDQYGDATSASDSVTVYRVDNGAWVPVRAAT